MPAVITPPPRHPWRPRRELAFNPTCALIPCDEGSAIRDYAGGYHATRAGATSVIRGDFGPILATSGGSAVTGTVPFGDAITFTVAHYRAPDAPNLYPGLAGWGNGSQGIGYSPTAIGLLSFSGALVNPYPIAYPTRLRIFSVGLAGHAAGSDAEFWIDGERVWKGTLATALNRPTGFRLGAAWNGNVQWYGGIGPAYAHPRVLDGREIRDLHADLYLILRSRYNPLPRTFAAVPVPWIFSGTGSGPSPAGAGSLGFAWKCSGSGTAAPAVGASELGVAWAFAGLGVGGEPLGLGGFGAEWAFAGLGVGGEALGSGVLLWPPIPRPDPRKASWAPGEGSPDPHRARWSPGAGAPDPRSSAWRQS